MKGKTGQINLYKKGGVTEKVDGFYQDFRFGQTPQGIQIYRRGPVGYVHLAEGKIIQETLDGLPVEQRRQILQKAVREALKEFFDENKSDRKKSSAA